MSYYYNLNISTGILFNHDSEYRSNNNLSMKIINYLNRNNWGKGGLVQGSEPEQWSDYNAGVNLGWKLSKSLGIFIEGEYIKFWDVMKLSSATDVQCHWHRYRSKYYHQYVQ